MEQIGELEITDNAKLVLSLGEFRGSQRVDLRTYVKLKDKEEYTPTKKGINFNAEWVDDFIKLIEKLKDAKFD